MSYVIREWISQRAERFTIWTLVHMSRRRVFSDVAEKDESVATEFYELFSAAAAGVAHGGMGRRERRRAAGAGVLLLARGR